MTQAPSRRFIIQPVATIAMLLGLGVLISLGTWQLQRRAWKLDLIASVEQRASGSAQPLEPILAQYLNGDDVRYTKVSVTGRYDHTREAHIFGTLGPKPGYYIFTPITTDNPALPQPLYINRGFVPQDNKAPATRPEGQTQGQVTVTGLFRYPEEKTGVAALVAPADQPESNIWYTRDPRRFASNALPSQSQQAGWYIDSLGTENPHPLPQGNTTRIDFNNRHLEYALTWYGLALTLIGVWAAWSWRRI